MSLIGQNRPVTEVGYAVRWQSLNMGGYGPVLESFTIDNDLAVQTSGAIEVTLHLRGHGPRWCYFMRPETLAVCGDWIPDTSTRIHFGSPHMIVVGGELNAEIIGQALRQIDAVGDLERCSLPLAEA